MAKELIYNVITGEITEIEMQDIQPDVEKLRADMIQAASDVHKNVITQGFISSATGAPIRYGYSQQDQLNYSKWANVFALNLAKESIIIGTVSNGVVAMTRQQFIQFIADAEAYEVELYQKKIDLVRRITQAGSVDELHQIVIELS